MGEVQNVFMMEHLREYIHTMKALVMSKVQLALEQQDRSPDDCLTLSQSITMLEGQILQIEEKNRVEKRFIPLLYVVDIFNCNRFEKHVLSLLIAWELNEATSGIREAITPFLARLTFDEVLTDHDVFQAFCEESVLDTYFLDRNHKNRTSGQKRVLLLEPRMRSFLINGTTIYEPYQYAMTIWNPYEELDFLYDAKGIMDKLVQCTSLCVADKSLGICLFGRAGSGRKFYMKHLAKKWNQAVIFLDSTSLLTEEAEYKHQVSAFIRECYLLQALPVIVGEKRPMQWLLYMLSKHFPLFFLSAEEKIKDDSNREEIEWFSLSIGHSVFSESKTIWEAEGKKYPLDPNVSIEEMASKFHLTPGNIKNAIRIANSYRHVERQAFLTKNMLMKGCYSLLEQAMNQKAVHVEGIYEWEQLVLPSGQKDMLMTACNQVKYKGMVYEQWGLSQNVAYGKGVSMVFFGPPGTGKTMAAQVLSKELGLDIYKVELAAVVSKYVGETEKNLNEIFEQAKKSQIVLFFDEADVLFSKRTEVKDSNDKYSNMEAAFMLQKMEEYDGTTILATNYLQNFDEAFKRRIKFMVEFPFPEAEYRREIWKKIIPKQMPSEELDFEYLGRFLLSGGAIKNVVIHSAFLAASEQKSLGMSHIIRGIRNEYTKNGKALTREEMGEYYMILHEGV